MKSRSHETATWAVILLALILLAAYLLRNKLTGTSSTSVSANGQPIYQQCFAIDGSPFYWRVDQGPCPLMVTSGQT